MLLEISQDMKDFFYKRTNEHIDRVKKYLDIILNQNYKDVISLVLEIEKQKHDEIKFQEPWITPYILLTWKKKLKQENIPCIYGEEVEESIIRATEYHVLNSTHHPEAWDPKGIAGINKNDRDKPSGYIVNAKPMFFSSMACMCADWMAMAEELGTCPFEWARNNINVRWEFTKEQEAFIYKVLKDCWNYFKKGYVK